MANVKESDKMTDLHLLETLERIAGDVSAYANALHGNLTPTDKSNIVRRLLVRSRQLQELAYQLRTRTES